MTLEATSSAPAARKETKANVQLDKVFVNMQRMLNATAARYSSPPDPNSPGKKRLELPSGTAKRIVRGAGASRLSAYKSRFPDLKVCYNETNGTAKFIKAKGLFVPGKTAKTADIPLACLQNLRELLGVHDAHSEFRKKSEVVDDLGLTHVKFQQVYNGLVLSGKEIIVHLDKDQSVYLVEGRVEPTPQIDVTATLSGEQALDVVRGELGHLDALTTCELVIYFGRLNFARLAYDISAVRGLETWKYFVDAKTGQVVEKYDDTRHVSVSGSGSDSWGQTYDFPVWQQGGYNCLVDTTQSMHVSDPSIPNNCGSGNIAVLSYNGADPTTNSQASLYFIYSNGTNGGWDPVAVGVYANLRRVQDYFRQTFNRKAIDNQGLNSIGVIHCGGQNLAGNAGWFPGMNMIFFGEDGAQMASMAKALDFTAHEFTHGITSYSANMEYMYQSGALNEAMSDIFACMVDRDDWTMGEDIVGGSAGYARNLADPHQGLESQEMQQAGIGVEPAHMNEYRNLPSNQDNGGVHVNCTIPGHAAYLIAEGLGSGSIGRAKTEQIFYRALTMHLTRQSNFSDARNATVQSAEELYGAASPEVQAVTAGWDAVGVTGAGGTGGDGGGGQVAAATGIDGIVFIFEDAGLSYLGGRQGTGDLYLISNYSVTNTRPVVTEDGVGVLFVDSTNNLRMAALSPTDVYDEAVTTEGYVRTIGGSQDGRYFAFTTTDQDNKLYLLDMNDMSGQSNKVFDLSLPSDSNVNVQTLKYADVIDFDLTGKRIIFDALSEIKMGDSSDTVRTWSIGILDIATGKIQSLVPGQQQGIQIGNPAASNTKDWLVAVDVWDKNTSTYETLIVNLNTGQAGLVAQEANPTTMFGFPTFSGDDTYIAMMYQDTIINVPVVELSGTFAGDFDNRTAILNTCYYPRCYRAGKRDIAPKIQASSASIDFGDCALNEPATKTLTITNSGTYDLTIDHVELSDTQNFSCNGTHATIPAGQSIDVTLTFNAREEGDKSATLTIVSDDAASPTISIALRGNVPAGTGTPAAGGMCGSSPPFLVVLLLFGLMGRFLSDRER